MQPKDPTGRRGERDQGAQSLYHARPYLSDDKSVDRQGSDQHGREDAEPGRARER